MSQQRVAAARRVSDAETCDGILVQSAILEVRPRRLPFQCPLKLFHKKRLRFAMHLHQNGALLTLFSLLRRTILLSRNRNPAFFRDDADGIRERTFFHLHDELENVPALTTAEAVINLAHRMHVERWRLLRMERTQPAEILPGLLELDVFPHHADNVRLLLHLLRK